MIDDAERPKRRKPGKKKMKKRLLGLMMMAPMVAAEPTQYRIGDLISSLFDVLGFAYLDFSSALVDFAQLLLLAFILLGLWYVWKRKHS